VDARGKGGGGGVAALRGLSQSVQLYKGAQINFGDLTPYLTSVAAYDSAPCLPLSRQ